MVPSKINVPYNHQQETKTFRPCTGSQKHTILVRYYAGKGGYTNMRATCTEHFWDIDIIFLFTWPLEIHTYVFYEALAH